MHTVCLAEHIDGIFGQTTHVIKQLTPPDEIAF
jgi:hypothetical protein